MFFFLLALISIDQHLCLFLEYLLVVVFKVFEVTKTSLVLYGSYRKHEKSIVTLQFAKNDEVLLACDEEIITVNILNPVHLINFHRFPINNDILHD